VWLRAVSPSAAGLTASEKAIARSKWEGEDSVRVLTTLARKEAVSQL
jgi:hypothetical protein